MSFERTLVASDAHLGAAPVVAERTFLDFLSAVPGMTNDLLLAGDVFDFWFEYRTVVMREHFDALRVLADVVDAGVRVRMVGGNHDAWFGSFLRDEVGVQILEGPLVTPVGGRRTYLAHGDGLAGGDWAYRLFKTVSRSPPARGLFRWLHPDLAIPAVKRISRTSGEPRPGRKSRRRADRLSEDAVDRLRDDPGLDLVIYGHSHRPELQEVEEGRHYLNAGDWLRHFTYGVVTPASVRLLEWRTPRGG